MPRSRGVSAQIALELGREARRNGAHLDDNPFPSYSARHDLWRRGWEEEDALITRSQS
ncbi:ribosome modulation factor [Bradyrhizobium shewense]|uniref:ribosome modulation factor n=1 Tax=Bradyrhizobium shewense TaxID=1761772 RepID=UPI003D317965